MKIGFKNLGKPMITVEVPAEAQDLTLREIVEIVLLSVYGDMPCPHPIMVVWDGRVAAGLNFGMRPAGSRIEILEIP